MTNRSRNFDWPIQRPNRPVHSKDVRSRHFPTTFYQAESRNTQVMDEFVWRPLKTVTFFLSWTKREDSCCAECEDVFYFVDYGGATVSGRSNAEGGREERKEENDARRVENEVMNAVVADGLVTSATSGDLIWRMTETRGIPRSLSALVEESFNIWVEGWREMWLTGAWMMRWWDNEKK